MEDTQKGKKLFYVPLSIKMILECKGEECLIDDAEIKSVLKLFKIIGGIDRSNSKY